MRSINIFSEEVHFSYGKAIKWGLDLEQPDKPYILQFSKKALDLYFKFQNEIEIRMREDEDLFHIKPWASKFMGTAARIIGLVHISDNVYKEPWNIEIPYETALSAIGFCEVLISHTKAIFGFIEEDPLLEKAKKVINWIEKQQSNVFSQQQCHHKFQHLFQKADEVAQVLEILAEHNYIRKNDKKTVTGRPSKLFEVNPDVFKKD